MYVLIRIGLHVYNVNDSEEATLGSYGKLQDSASGSYKYDCINTKVEVGPNAVFLGGKHMRSMLYYLP